MPNIHEHPAARLSRQAIARRRLAFPDLSATWRPPASFTMTIRTLLFALAAGFLFAAPLCAQTTDALDYVDHASLDFAHYPVPNTNIALYYRDRNGVMQPPSTDSSSNIFWLFSTKELHFLAYNSAGIIPQGDSDWLPTTVPMDVQILLTNRTQVSYTPIATDGGPGADYQSAFMTGTRSSLYAYNLVSGSRLSTTTLETDSPTEPYTPANALLTTGYSTSLVVTNGGIYSVDTRNPIPGLLTPLVTTQGTGEGELSNPSAMNVGPDGLLYVLDYGLDEAGQSNGVNRIEKFDLATGEYRGQFFLPDGVTVFSTSLAISLEGHIYLGDGLGGGLVFDLDGTLLGTFHPPAPDPSWVDGGLIAGNTAGPSFLQYDGLGNIFTYVEGQGIFMYHDPSYIAVPEPSTCALAIGGLFGLIVLRRRRMVL